MGLKLPRRLRLIYCSAVQQASFTILSTSASEISKPNPSFKIPIFKFSFFYCQLTKTNWQGRKLVLYYDTKKKHKNNASGEQEHAQFCTNHDITSGWSCRRPEKVSILSFLFLGRRQLQPDVTSWFVQYCACSCSPHCRRAPVGDVKLVCLALWREREYLTFISIRFVAFSNQNFADYRS